MLVFSPSHSLFNSNNNNNSNINSNNNNFSNNPSASNINTALSHDYDATLPLSKEALVKIETLIEYERIAKKKEEDKKNAPWWNHIHYKIMFTLSVITVAQSFRMVRGEAEERIELLQLRKDKETLEEDLATTEAIALVATKIIDAHESNGEGAIDNIHGLRKELEARLKARYDMIERRKAVEQLRKRTMVD